MFQFIVFPDSLIRCLLIDVQMREVAIYILFQVNIALSILGQYVGQVLQ